MLRHEVDVNVEGNQKNKYLEITLTCSQLVQLKCVFLTFLKHAQAFILAGIIISCLLFRNEDRMERSERQTCTKMDSIEAAEEQ